MPRLTEQEQQEIIRYLEADKPLPDKYRFLLFADKREVELVWNGKTNEVSNIVLPFQVIEQVDEPRAETDTRLQMMLFDLDSRGRQLKGWTNKLIWGDNKLILSSLKNGPLREEIEAQGGLKLIYIDPPFDVGADFSMNIEIGGDTFTKKPNILEEIAYRDTWGKGADSFIAMIYERLVSLRDLLAEDGSIYVHCDWRVNSLLRLVLDEVFGTNRFRNELIWQKIRSSKAQSAKFGNVQDSIFFYAKADAPIFNTLRLPHSGDYIQSHYRYMDENTGKRYRLDNFTQSGQGPARRFADRELAPPAGKHWIWSQERIDEAMKEGLLVFSRDGMPSVKRFLEDVGGNVIEDIWADIAPINSMSKERVDYPTQKPEALLERIIRASSNEGDLVADFFVGSGTTAAVAEKLGRKWIVSDLGKFAIHTTRKRLIQVQRELKKEGKPFRPFEVLNLGRYERQAYLNVSGRLSGKQREQALARKEQEFRDLILKAYRAEPLGGSACVPPASAEHFFHGKHAGRLVVVGPINLPVGRLFVEEVITECRKRNATRVDVLAFEFEMGLFPAVLEEARQKGIELAPKTIPPEVFDKRAVEKGQVRFADVAFIEVTPRFDGKSKLSVAVELTDFSVYYSQGIAKAIEAELKEGKSEVVCEQGALIKFSKDKKGAVTRDKLTKHWTDWVDYWAVDFDYESRPEVILRTRSIATGEDLADWNPKDRGLVEHYEHRTGASIFENEWQSFRTRQNRELEFTSAKHTYAKPGRYIIAVKVIDIFGNDTMTLVPITAG